MNDEQRQYLERYTKKERLANWFAYHKWWLLLGVVILAALSRIIWQNITKIQPDYRFAYVGASILPDDTVKALESALADYGTDLNHDGHIVVQLNQYPTADSGEDGGMNQTVWETKLMADLLKGESYFFLLDDPNAFQHEHQLLAELDGSVPGIGSRDGLDKVYLWSDCPVLASMDLGVYTEVIAGEKMTGENLSLIENLYLGRRYFLEEAGVKEPPGCADLWDTITKGASK